jgi:hypothetical protein
VVLFFVFSFKDYLVEITSVECGTISPVLVALFAPVWVAQHQSVYVALFEPEQVAQLHRFEWHNMERFIHHMYNLTDGDFDEYKNKAEFEVMTLIEKWRLEEAQTCEMCGSPNVEVLQVQVNDYPLYDYDNLVERCRANHDYMIMFNIDKRGSDINLQHGGSQNIEKDFYEAAIQQIIDLLNYRPPNTFTPQIYGNFFICLIGGYNFMEEKVIIRLERFRSSGLTRDEILNAIRPFAKQIGVTISQSQDSTIHGASILDGKTFKGALFNSWFYAESGEQADREGYSYANACFKLDDNTVIAYGTAFDESPRDFIDNNQFSDFVVDTTKEPFRIKGKTVYYAKRC